MSGIDPADSDTRRPSERPEESVSAHRRAPDPVVMAIGVAAVVLGSAALVARPGGMEPGLGRSFATTWALLLILLPAFGLAPSRRNSERVWYRWRAAWSAAVVLLVLHSIVAIVGPLGGRVSAVLDSPLVSTPAFNLVLGAWWTVDVAQAWRRSDWREASPAVTRQRSALHLVVFITVAVAAVLTGSPTGRLLGICVLLTAVAAFVFRGSAHPMRNTVAATATAALILLASFPTSREGLWSLSECARLARSSIRPVAEDRADRFLGKVQPATARCRGGALAVRHRSTPWVDWSNYWGTADSSSLALAWSPLGPLSPAGRGVDGSLLDLEYQRIELLRHNLFDNAGTFADYVRGRAGLDGRALKTWPEMRLASDHPAFSAVGGDREQVCEGELIRFRTLSGICNDIRNPAMGSTGMLFGRNVPFEETFPERGLTEFTQNRHDGRIGLLSPDPQMVSRRLFTRSQSEPEACRGGVGAENPVESRCDYRAAPFFNVLAAFWIQFMTHDWFSHLDEGRNAAETMSVGCVDPSSGCRPDDRMTRSLSADDSQPPSFTLAEEQRWNRAPTTTRNHVTAWWDASQIYGYDTTSFRRVKRDPADPARLLLRPTGLGEQPDLGTLPVFGADDPIDSEWVGQEAVAFPDNWSVGLSFLHNVFAREHNLFVAAFRAQAREAPDEDSGLRDPRRPRQVIPNSEVTDEELYQIGRLVVSAEIAKIHTIEWTTQLLYNEPLYRAMNSNWSGLLGDDLLGRATARIAQRFAQSGDETAATEWFSVFVSGSGIFGLGNRRYDVLEGRDVWDISNPDHVNGGVNHFGSPFNFPEEFISVYRLHPLVPDLIELRTTSEPDRIARRLPVVSTFRGGATAVVETIGMPDLGVSMGRQRLGLLSLANHPAFLQNLPMPVARTGTGKLDVAALDLIRDRERGIPRFNEFRRQYGLRSLTSFDDFVDQRLPEDSPERAHQEALVTTLREVYGQHTCDETKVITRAQRVDGSYISDCLGHPDGTVVDNVEDVDIVVGFLAESTRPHGFAISETQFTVFILNASRRLFSDRFFTSSFRPEFYSHFGVRWVNDNGPDGPVMEEGRPNGHRQEVLPFKRVLMRTIPSLAGELRDVVNAFDPWARDRGGYYSLAWRPRPDATGDESFESRPPN